MTDPKPNDPFEPFITVSLGNRKTAPWHEPSPAIAVTSNCPGTTAIHWYTAQTARLLAAEITRLADALDPPAKEDVRKTIHKNSLVGRIEAEIKRKRRGVTLPAKRKAKRK
jgi:hypothetical protein